MEFGLNPDEVADFVAEYGWRLIEQAGPDYYLHNYIRPAGRDLAASELEWTAYAEKPSRLDLDDSRHDHRLAAIGLPHPLADGAAYRLRDPGDVGDFLGRQGFPAPPRPSSATGSSALGSSEKPRECRCAGAAGRPVPRCTTTVTAMKPEDRSAVHPKWRRRRRR